MYAAMSKKRHSFPFAGSGYLYSGMRQTYLARKRYIQRKFCKLFVFLYPFAFAFISATHSFLLTHIVAGAKSYALDVFSVRLWNPTYFL